MNPGQLSSCCLKPRDMSHTYRRMLTSDKLMYGTCCTLSEKTSALCIPVIARGHLSIQTSKVALAYSVVIDHLNYSATSQK